MPQMHDMFGAEETHLLCAVSALQFLCGPRTINFKEKGFPRASSDYGIFLCGEEKLWRQLSLRENSLEVLKI